jgi:GSCFA family protein
MQSPYEGLGPEAFWRTGVVSRSADDIPFLYRPKVPIDRSLNIATAGSCFAQHIARHLRLRGFSVIDTEPPPKFVPADVAARFGYGIYSARYGNIYTARQLKQLFLEVFGRFTPGDAVWEKDGRFYDALRPGVEPNGLSSPEVVAEHRSHHLGQIRKILAGFDVLVFTLGLTEAWVHRDSGTVYPTAPGTIAGRFDPAEYEFRNFTFREIYEDLVTTFEGLRGIKPQLRLLLTVSPVPLTATASGQHVLCATTYSKSVLRAVAGQLCQEYADIDYFPAYEIVTSPLANGRFFEDNLRTVGSRGVEAVMKTFFAAHDPAPVEHVTKEAPIGAEPDDVTVDEQVVCEEAMLDAFAG